MENSKCLRWLKELLFHRWETWKTWKNWMIMPHGEAECLYLHTYMYLPWRHHMLERNGRNWPSRGQFPFLSHLWQTMSLKISFKLLRGHLWAAELPVPTPAAHLVFDVLFIAQRTQKSPLFTAIKPPPGSWDRSFIASTLEGSCVPSRVL